MNSNGVKTCLYANPTDAYGNVQDYFINQFILKDWRLYLRIYMYTQK